MTWKDKQISELIVQARDLWSISERITRRVILLSKYLANIDPLPRHKRIDKLKGKIKRLKFRLEILDGVTDTILGELIQKELEFREIQLKNKKARLGQKEARKRPQSWEEILKRLKEKRKGN